VDAGGLPEGDPAPVEAGHVPSRPRRRAGGSRSALARTRGGRRAGERAGGRRDAQLSPARRAGLLGAVAPARPLSNRPDLWLVNRGVRCPGATIVTLICFLVGLILAFIGSRPAPPVRGADLRGGPGRDHQWPRRWGPMMTGIILAGARARPLPPSSDDAGQRRDRTPCAPWGSHLWSSLSCPDGWALILMDAAPHQSTRTRWGSWAGPSWASTMLKGSTSPRYLHENPRGPDPHRLRQGDC